MTTTSDYMDEAESLGRDHGRNAASWTIDGNTTRETIAYVVKGFNDGDPAVYDQFREPSFSGDYCERDLCDDLGIDYDLTEEADEITDAYLQAAREMFWEETERLYRNAMGTNNADALLHVVQAEHERTSHEDQRCIAG